MAAELATSLVITEADRLLQAEALVRAYCGWHIAPQRTETVTMAASGSATLILPTLALADIVSITEDGQLLAAEGYQWSPAGVVTRYWWSEDENRQYWRWLVGPVVVEFTHGYQNVPAEVQAIVQAVAQRALDNPGSRPRAQAGPFADSYSQVGANQAPALALLDAEKAALDHYRLPPRP